VSRKHVLWLIQTWQFQVHRTTSSSWPNPIKHHAQACDVAGMRSLDNLLNELFSLTLSELLERLGDFIF